jgi:hypothetical protein
MTHNSANARGLTRRAAFAMTSAALATPVIGRAQTPAMILAGGPIYTGHGAAKVEALVIQGDRIGPRARREDHRSGRLRGIPGLR